MGSINKPTYCFQSLFSIPIPLLLSTIVLFQLTTAQTEKFGFHTTNNSSFSGSIYESNNNNNTKPGEFWIIEKLLNNNSFDRVVQPSPEPEPINHPCDELLKNTSEAFGEFYKCTIASARPYRFCEDCSRVYLKATRIYGNITASDGSSSPFNCKKYLLESDNSPVIKSAIANIVTIWSDAYCDHCFEESLDFSTRDKNNLSNSTLKFLLLYQNLTDCITDSIINDKPANICRTCHYAYKALNNKFNEIEKMSSSTVCMDIMDRMNYTRIQWSNDFNCSTTEPRETILMSSIVITSITLPAIFYISTYIASKGVQIVREKLVKRQNAQAKLIRRHSSYESIDETHGINSPSVSSSSRT